MERVKATLYLLTAKMLGRLKQYGAALRLLQRAAALKPDSVATHCWIGWLHQQLKDYAAAVPSFECAIQLRPNCAYAHAQIACSWIELKRYRDAIDELLRAFRMNPSYKNNRRYLLVLASAYAQLDLMNDSVPAYEKASQLFPNDAESVYGYGWALARSKRFSEAEQVLRRAITLNPKNADAHYNLGVALLAQERWQDAADEFRSAISLEPTKSNQHGGLGTAYKELGQLNAASESLQEAIRLAPDDPDAYVQIGAVYIDLDRPIEALETGRKLKRLVPDQEVGDWIVIGAYSRLKRYDEAIQLCNEVLHKNPHSLPAVESLAWIHLKGGRFSEAIPLYERAITEHSDASYLRAQLAEAYLGDGDLEAAWNQQRELLSIDLSVAEAVRKLLQGDIKTLLT
jgi:tetratricopeptide (TPR) repeat protein